MEIWNALWVETQVGAVESAVRTGGGASKGPGVRGQQCTASIRSEKPVYCGIYIASKGTEAGNQ